MALMDKMTIDIWSDIACPFCFIGKKKLEMALSETTFADQVELIWHSYELGPELPKKADGRSYYQYLSDNYGVTIERARQMTQKTVDLGASVGLKLDYDRLVVANTFDALRLVKLAADNGLATVMEEALFQAYFTDGKDVSDHRELLAIAKEVGLSTAKTEQMLQGTSYEQDVRADIKRAEELNVDFVPWYQFNGKQVVEGSIEVAAYLEVLQTAYAEWSGDEAANGGDDSIIQGQSCTIDGICT